MVQHNYPKTQALTPASSPSSLIMGTRKERRLEHPAELHPLLL